MKIKAFNDQLQTGRSVKIKIEFAVLMGFRVPKEDIDGSMVKAVYYEDKDLDRIVKYCELDVITTAQVFLRLRNEELLDEDEIKRI